MADFLNDRVVEILASFGANVDQLRFGEDLDFSGRLAIFYTLRKLHPVLKDQHLLNPKEEEDDPYESTQITALIANQHGIFGVYSMREVFEYSQFWAVGSGREFALGAMNALYPRLKTAAAPERRTCKPVPALERGLLSVEFLCLPPFALAAPCALLSACP